MESHNQAKDVLGYQTIDDQMNALQLDVYTGFKLFYRLHLSLISLVNTLIVSEISDLHGTIKQWQETWHAEVEPYSLQDLHLDKLYPYIDHWKSIRDLTFLVYPCLSLPESVDLSEQTVQDSLRFCFENRPTKLISYRLRGQTISHLINRCIMYSGVKPPEDGNIIRTEYTHSQRDIIQKLDPWEKFVLADRRFQRLFLEERSILDKECVRFVTDYPVGFMAGDVLQWLDMRRRCPSTFQETSHIIGIASSGA